MKLKFYEALYNDMREVVSIYNEFLSSLKDLTADEYFDFKDLEVEEREELLKERMAKNQDKVLLVKDEDMKGGNSSFYFLFNYRLFFNNFFSKTNRLYRWGVCKGSL